MTVNESKILNKNLKKGTRVCWRGDAGVCHELRIMTSSASSLMRASASSRANTSADCNASTSPAIFSN